MSSWLYTNGVLTIVLNGSVTTVSNGHHNINKIKNELKKGDNASDNHIIKLIKQPKKVKPVKTKAKPACDSMSNDALGEVVIKDNRVYYNGELVEEKLTEMVRVLLNASMPTKPLLKFVARLYNNVSNKAIKSIPSFIEHNNLTIDSEGYIIAYKAVNSNYMDKYSRTVLYSIGTTVIMDRNKIDDRSFVGCSKGLHAGALKYVYSYGCGFDRIIIVKIDPADVVSVPNDCSHQKLRTCRLEVVGDYNGKLQNSCYKAEMSVDQMYEDDNKKTYVIPSKSVCDWHTVEQTSHHTKYGKKPCGVKFYQVRDNKGQFTKTP